MNKPHPNLVSARRQQIVDAAVAIIAEQGLQNLSLSEIEKRAGMSRGQLTYYFPAKEDILLAVFDRLLELMCQRIGTPRGKTRANACEATFGEWVRHLLEAVLLRPPASPEFHCLQYTFLSQIGHREDFRRRLASLYEEWRSSMARGLEEEQADNAGAPGVAPRTMASFVQAILHGLAMQLAADPNAFDREEMLDLCLDMLGMYLRAGGPARKERSAPANQILTSVGARRTRKRSPVDPSARR